MVISTTGQETSLLACSSDASQDLQSQSQSRARARERPGQAKPSQAARPQTLILDKKTWNMFRPNQMSFGRVLAQAAP